MKTPAATLGAQKVCIIGGFTEGNGHIKRCVRPFRAAGFHIVSRPSDADIIVTHSGGYLFLPDNLHGKMVVMVAAPCGYQSSRLDLFFKNWGIDVRVHRQGKAMRAFLRKDLYNFWYFFTKPRYNYTVARGVARFRFKLPQTNAQKTIVITNRDDLWTKDTPLEAIRKAPGYAFIGLPGAHDDLWLHPERYIATIRSVL